MAKGKRPVDEEVLRLSLDSTQFERGLNKAATLFDRIRDKIRGVDNTKLSNVGESFNKLGNHVKNVKFDNINTGIQSCISKVPIMEKIFEGTLLRIGHRVTDLGLRIANNIQNAMFSKSVSDGFREYETKIGAIQTIMSNTQGKHSIAEVTALLDELNKYADDTIYNFGDMTRNIGTFTAAGVGLKDSAISIKGISNLAAASGSSTQQASTAMYQLSQALAAGKVSLQDWNSVVNAGMGGKLFQDALKKNAIAMGKNIKMTDNFRASLQKGWLTSDVLIKTLKQFADDNSMKEAATKVKTWTQLWDTVGESMGSGWAKTWEIIVGNYEEAPKFLTRIKDGIEKIIESQNQWRDNIARTFASLDGKNRMLEALFKMFAGVGKLFSAIGEAWRAVFPPDTKKNVESFIKGFEDLMKFLTPSEELIGKIKEAMKGLFEIVKQIQPVFSILWSLTKEVFKYLSGPVLNLIIAVFTGTIGYILDFNRILINTFNNLTNIGENKGPGKMQKALKALFAMISHATNSLTNFVRNFKANSGSMVDSILEFFRESYTAVADFVKDIFTKINYKDIIATGISVFMFKKMSGILAGFKNGIGIINKVHKMSETITETIENVAEAISKSAESIQKSVDKAAKAFAKIPSAITANINAKTLLIMAVSIGILAGAMWILGQLPLDRLGAAAGAVVTLFAVLDQALKSMQKFQKKISSINMLELIASGITMVLLANALLLLSKAVSNLGGLNVVQMAAATGVVTVLMIVLNFTIRSLAKTFSMYKKGMKAVKGLIGFAAAIYILTYSVKALSDMNPMQLAKGLGGVSVLLIMMAAAMRIMNGSKVNLTAVAMMFVMSEIIKNLVKVMFDITKYPLKPILKALGVIAVLFGLVLASVIIIDKAPLDPGKIYAVSAYVTAIVGLVRVMEVLAKIPLKPLLKAIGAVGLIMLAVTVNIALLKGMKFSNKDIQPFLVYMIAILMLIKQIEPLSKIPFSSMVKAISGIAAIMSMLMLSMLAVSHMPKVSITSMVGIMLFVASTNSLIKQIEPLSKIPFSSMVKAIGGIGAIMTMLVATSFIISNIKIKMTSTAAILMLGFTIQILAGVLIELSKIPFSNFGSIAVGLVAITVLLAAMVGVQVMIKKLGGFKLSHAIGMLALAASVALLAVALKTLKDAEFKALAVSIGAIVIVLMALAAAAALMKVGGVVGIAGLTVALIGLSTALYAVSAVIGAFVLLVQILSSQGIMAFQNLGAGIQLLVLQLQISLMSILQFLMTSAPQIAYALATIVLGTIESILKVMLEKGPSIINLLVTTVLMMINEFLKAIAVNGPVVVQQLIDTVLALIAAVRDKIPDILQAAIDFILAFINGFADTIRNNEQKIKEALWNLLTAIGGFILGIFADIFKYFAENGPKVFGKILDFCAKLPGKIWEGIMNLGTWLFNKMSEIGGNFIDGLFKGIGDIGTAIWNFVKGGFDGLVGNIKKFFGIKSPSRLMMGIGGYISEGMAVGVGSNVGMVHNEMLNMAGMIKDDADHIADGLQDALNRQYNLTANVSPVLKDEDFKPIDLTGNIKANRFDNIIPSHLPTKGDSISNSNTNNYDIHIHATGDLPDSTIRKMATKIKQVIKNQNDSEIMALGRRGEF